MQWSSITAWSIVPGDIVSWGGVRKVASTHWAPTAADPVGGIVTLVWAAGGSAQFPGLAQLRHIAD